MLSQVRRVANKVTSSARNVVDAARTFGGDRERRAARDRVWEDLDHELRTTRQWLGTLSAGCFATHQVYERCDFSCTACYLGKEANDTPPLPWEDVKAQIDQIRDFAGPGSNLQVTAGEVTLLPVNELVRIVKYAKEQKLDTMVMSHGQTFYKDPGYLEKLVTEGGLEKVAIHIDTTQRGRIGWDKETMTREPDLHWIRDHFADLIRQTRKKTGVHLHAAHTFTITENNLDDVPEVMRWMKGNNDAFRMISFQPTADVGRTREREQVQQQDLVWSKIGEGLGIKEPNPHTFEMGHPKCNNTALMFVVRFENDAGEMEAHCMEVTRKGEDFDDWFWTEVMTGAFKDFYLDGATISEAAGRFAGMFGRSPKYLWQWPYYSMRRVLGERAWVGRFIKAALTGREVSVKPLIVVVHNFMSSHELDTEEGRARLDNCAFRLPVDGRMVPMCEMNGTDLRTKKNLETQERLVGIGDWKPEKKKKKKKSRAA